MKKLLIPLCLALSSCASLPTVAPNLNVCSVGQGTLVDEKVVYAAQVIYNIPAEAYVTADKAHQLTPNRKEQIKPLLIKLNDLRNAVKAAKGTVNCDFAAMQQLQVYTIKLLGD